MMPHRLPSILIALVGCLFRLIAGIELDIGSFRNITTAVNPGCPTNKCANFTVVYLKQQGGSDILHHLWAMETIPTFFYARTPIDTELTIDWEKMLSGDRNSAITFSHTPEYYAAVLIPRFFIYNDANDTGSIPENLDNNEIKEFSSSKMLWDLKSVNQTSNISATAVFRLKSFDGTILDELSNIQIELTVYGDRGRSSILPHLAYTENSTQIDFVFDKVPTNQSFVNGRLAVEIAVSVSEQGGNFSLAVSKSLDDEYTPGVFKLTEMRSPAKNHWMQWRPVCYTSMTRDIGDSTGLYETSIKNLTGSFSLDDTILGQLTLLKTDPIIEGFVVSFGTQGDGFYQATNYTAWTLVTGHGQPLGDQFSLMVILVMAIGLGLPAVVLILGGAGIAARNYKKNKDDLLLSN